MDRIRLLVPEFDQEYAKDTPFSILIAPKESCQDEEALAFLKKNNKATFKRDAVDILVA